jgi:mannose/fructose/N-acetylgalactosamine-specific phosphotransferase system component IID
MLLKVLWRSLFINTTLNDRNLQNLGLVYCIQPVLKEVVKDTRMYLQRLTSYFEYFYSNPFFATVILGICINLERKNKFDMIHKIKLEAMSPIAALADSLVWGTLKPFATLIFGSMAFLYMPVGPIGFWVVLFLSTNFFRVYNLFASDRLGLGIIFHLSKLNLQQVIEFLKRAAVLYFGGFLLIYLARELHHIPHMILDYQKTVLAAYFALNALVLGRFRNEVSFGFFLALFTTIYFLKS